MVHEIFLYNIFFMHHYYYNKKENKIAFFSKWRMILFTTFMALILKLCVSGFIIDL